MEEAHGQTAEPDVIDPEWGLETGLKRLMKNAGGGAGRRPGAKAHIDSGRVIRGVKTPR
jgi:hypothetical protein